MATVTITIQDEPNNRINVSVRVDPDMPGPGAEDQTMTHAQKIAAALLTGLYSAGTVEEEKVVATATPVNLDL